MLSKLKFLVKAQNLPAKLRLALNGKAKVPLHIEPLFTSIGNGAAHAGLAAGAPPPGATWFQVTADVSADAVNSWDHCHALLADSTLGVQFVEPDLQQRWPVASPRARTLGLAVTEGEAEAQDKNFPPAKSGPSKDNLWFREAGFSQFDAALASIDDPGDGKRVRIAHLDTGFDPDHKTKPAHINVKDQRNFVDEDFPLDARDRDIGILNNFSHGTGTISILAGSGTNAVRGFGCAPHAEVIPIRVANRVVLFRNSAIAKAFDHVHSLKPGVHVISMSLGGYPSQAWVDAMNALYEAGVLVVTAAGNNFGNAPTRFVVYPARFSRAIAACGIMADFTPYADLGLTLMAGNYGPASKMKTAIAAYTPNIPWARLGEPEIVDFDGAGTSAATPQVAGAAALWIQKHRTAYDAYSKPWMRVEAVRHALFASAAKDHRDDEHFGNGRLRVDDLLKVNPPAEKDLVKQGVDNVDDAVAKILFGVGLAQPSIREAMLALEAQQVAQATGAEMHLLESGDRVEKGRFIDRLLSGKGISEELRNALSKRKGAAAAATASTSPEEALALKRAVNPPYPVPPMRRLRIFAYDPSIQTDPKMFGINEAIIPVIWEDNLEPGPVGEYLEVVDVDPPSQACYAPVDLNHPHLLAERGLPPSESSPQFHQQMVYAVAMATIARFEKALGRTALWAPRLIRDSTGKFVSRSFVRRLRIYPHALCEENSYYSRANMALLFGYFQSSEEEIGPTLPGARVFCAVSHDIIAHETTHALLDGLHPRYLESANLDTLAFHEAFADIVALFQHFSIPEALLRQIKNTKGNLEHESLLGQLAVQFGEASGRHGALRSAIGKKVEGKWEKTQPSRKNYDDAQKSGRPHDLGAVLVSAVFAAFVTIYTTRSAAIIRLATDGTGILPDGDISHDLAERLAAEAAKAADQVLIMCIRALDYCPPLDLTFGEYLRAIITADRDLVPDDTLGYRVAFIAAFRDRGIFPEGVRHLAEDSLIWEPPPLATNKLELTEGLLNNLHLRWNLNTDRTKADKASQENAEMVLEWLLHPEDSKQWLLEAMGFHPPQKDATIAGMIGEIRNIEVHSVRPARRTAPDGTAHSMLVVEITQTFRADPNKERFRGGCTVLIDLTTNQPKYFIRKRLDGVAGGLAQKDGRLRMAAWAAERRLRYTPPGPAGEQYEPLRLLHLCGTQE